LRKGMEEYTSHAIYYDYEWDLKMYNHNSSREIMSL